MARTVGESKKESAWFEQAVRKAGDGDRRKMGDGVDAHLGVEDCIGGGVKFVQQQKFTAFPFSFHCSIQVGKSRGETKRDALSCRTAHSRCRNEGSGYS